METDPFDADSGARVFPFLAVLYSDSFETVVIWEENFDQFVTKVIAAIESLPDSYTIYAHNGGKFDYLFLLHKIRGFVLFKGRGLMSCRIGNHELRDSFHIIPERLANWQKDTFDYSKLKRNQRNKYRDEIIRYCINDCRYLLQIVRGFLDKFGFKISIGQAAMAELRRSYKVKKMSEATDGMMRDFFYGGRVECLQGKGHWRGDYKLYDVNSMYPFVMATYDHPVSNEFYRRKGEPGPATCFVELECENYDALIGKTEQGETTSNVRRGTFRASIYEYRVALRHNLISDVNIISCIDFAERSNFAKFVTPFYEQRQDTKRRLKVLEEGTTEYNECKKDDIFLKLILNNAYGKFAQNPRNYKETYISAHGERPPDDEEGFDVLPVYECEQYDIWERPNPRLTFNNVATAASITGAARSVLLEAICNADDPIYCDTDSIICKSLAADIDNERLGAWKLEATFDEVIIAGKKLYGMKIAGLDDCNPKRIKVKSKGVSGLTWPDLVKLLDAELAEIVKRNPGPTFNRRGEQYYISRRIRATAPARHPILTRRIEWPTKMNASN